MDGALNQFAQAAAPAADAEADAEDVEALEEHVANANEPDVSDTSGSYVLQPPDEEADADAELPLPDADEGSCASCLRLVLTYCTFSYCLFVIVLAQIIALTISARRTRSFLISCAFPHCCASRTRRVLSRSARRN